MLPQDLFFAILFIIPGVFAKGGGGRGGGGKSSGINLGGLFEEKQCVDNQGKQYSCGMTTATKVFIAVMVIVGVILIALCLFWKRIKEWRKRRMFDLEAKEDHRQDHLLQGNVPDNRRPAPWAESSTAIALKNEAATLPAYNTPYDPPIPPATLHTQTKVSDNAGGWVAFPSNNSTTTGPTTSFDHPYDPPSYMPNAPVTMPQPHLPPGSVRLDINAVKKPKKNKKNDPYDSIVD